MTYCVGGLSLCNSIAGAYAEKSPVVVISGSPGLRERFNNPLLHHKVKDFRTQSEVFDQLCVAGAELNDPQMAFREIDRVLDAAAATSGRATSSCRATWSTSCPNCRTSSTIRRPVSDPGGAGRGGGRGRAPDRRRQRPVIIAGVEIHRFGLQDDLLALAEGAQIPIATTMLGKSVISETHPLFAGIYEGAMGREEVTQFVEESDCVILLGAFMTDINLGIYTANLDPGRCIYATSEKLRIRHHHLSRRAAWPISFAGWPPPAAAAAAARFRRPPSLADEHFQLQPDEPITIRG